MGLKPAPVYDVTVNTRGLSVIVSLAYHESYTLAQLGQLYPPETNFQAASYSGKAIASMLVKERIPIGASEDLVDLLLRGGAVCIPADLRDKTDLFRFWITPEGELKGLVRKNGAVQEKVWTDSKKTVPLSEFQELGTNDTSEAAAKRPFAYPPKGKSGLWVGSIPRGAQVSICERNYGEPGVFTAHRPGVLVGRTPLFLENLKPGQYAVQVRPEHRQPHTFTGGHPLTGPTRVNVDPDYHADDGRTDLYIQIVAVDEKSRLYGVLCPTYSVQVEPRKVTYVNALTYDDRSRIEDIAKLYPDGNNFHLPYPVADLVKANLESPYDVFKQFGEDGLRQMYTLIQRGGVFSTPKSMRGRWPLLRQWISPEGELRLGRIYLYEAGAESEITKVRGSERAPFAKPEVVPDQAAAEAPFWDITNGADARLTLFLSGPEKRVVEIEAGKSRTLTLPAGSYEVAARVDRPSVLPFYGEQESRKGNRYTSRFVIRAK